MRKVSYFIVPIILFYTLTMHGSYGGGSSGLEFRFVHPDSPNLPDCDNKTQRKDLIEYECFSMPVKNEGAGKKKTIWINRNVVLKGDMIKEVEVKAEPVNLDDQFDRMLKQYGYAPKTESVGVYIELDEQGSKQLRELTTKHVKEQLAIVLDGQLLIAPIIHQPITDGRFTIAMSTREEAEDVAEKIRAKLKNNLKP